MQYIHGVDIDNTNRVLHKIENRLLKHTNAIGDIKRGTLG